MTVKCTKYDSYMTAGKNEAGCGMQIKFHPNPKNREKRRALSYS